MNRYLLFSLGLTAGVFALAAAFVPARADEIQPERKTEAAPAKPSEAELTATIDREIAKVWERDGVTPAPRSDDAEFLRRVYLDVVGIPPRADEAAAFLDDKSPDKRVKLIDKLVNDPRFGEHLADQWLTVLAGRGKANQNADLVLGVWLAEQFNAGRGFDQVIYDMISAQGKMSDNPAAAYYGAKKEIRTADVAGEATKHFTGVQIQCAQCHDHPYEENWKVADFNGVASFFWPLQMRSKGDMRPKQGDVFDQKGQRADFKKLEKKLAKADAEQKEKLMKSSQWQAPKFLGGKPLAVDDARLWRKAWAAWVIDDANTQTQKYVANRFWSFLFGSGLHNPVDDFNSFNEPSHPELLQALARDVRDSGFDIKRLYRAILKSRTWQLSSLPAKGAETWHFANYPVRQLSPEQFFAALINVRNQSQTKRGMREGKNPYEKELQQAKAYMKREAEGKLGKNEKRFEYDLDALEKLRAQLDRMSDDWWLRRAASRDFSRSSEDDEMTEADGFSLTIDQALLVMNGEATTLLSDWGKGSVLDGVTGSSDKLEKQVERLYLVVLSRRPTEAESKRLLDHIKQAADTKAAWEDALFSLLVGTVFATTH